MSRARKPSGRRKRQNRGRTTASYRRRPGKRQYQKTIFIFCEGSKTEPRYFGALKAARRRSNVRIVVHPGGGKRTDPCYLIQYAVATRTRELDWDPKVDETWCVFDIEREGDRPNVKEIMEQAGKAEIALAVSNPAVEYWFLLHFESTDRPFVSAQEVIEALRKYVPNYSKGLSVYECVKDRTDHAIAHAQQLRRQASPSWGSYPNPSTSVDDLVKELWVSS